MQYGTKQSQVGRNNETIGTPQKSHVKQLKFTRPLPQLDKVKECSDREFQLQL